MKKRILIVLFLALSLCGFSQSNVMSFARSLAQTDEISGANVVVNCDSMSSLSLGSSYGVKHITGYKICVFFDNSQSARQSSSYALSLLRARFPKIKSQQVYVNPIWKVFAGECVTKVEANNLLGILKAYFPKAFIVTEKMPIELFMERLTLDPTALQQSDGTQSQAVQ